MPELRMTSWWSQTSTTRMVLKTVRSLLLCRPDDEAFAVAPGRQAGRREHGRERFFRCQAVDRAVQHDPLDTLAQRRIVVIPLPPLLAADPVEKRRNGGAFETERRRELADPAPFRAERRDRLALRDTAARHDQRLARARRPPRSRGLERDRSLPDSHA